MKYPKWIAALLSSLMLSMVAVMFCSVPPVKAEVPPAIRYVQVETIQVENLTFGDEVQPPETILTTHYTFTFALFKLNANLDRCYFTALVKRKDYYLTSSWWLAFSGFPPGNAGMGGNLLKGEIINAEYPYASQEISNPLDGVQTYYFYRIHVWVEGAVAKGDTIELAADYMKEPVSSTTTVSVSDPLLSASSLSVTTSTGSSDILKLQKASNVGDVTVFKLKHLKK